MSFGGERKGLGLLATCSQQVGPDTACAVELVGLLYSSRSPTSIGVLLLRLAGGVMNRNGFVFQKSSRSANGGDPLVLHHLVYLKRIPRDSRRNQHNLERKITLHQMFLLTLAQPMPLLRRIREDIFR